MKKYFYKIICLFLCTPIDVVWLFFCVCVLFYFSDKSCSGKSHLDNASCAAGVNDSSNLKKGSIDNYHLEIVTTGTDLVSSFSVLTRGTGDFFH